MTGLCRYDTLTDFKADRQILVMPMWRSWLNGLQQTEFVRTDYFTAWQLLLNSDHLESILKKHGYTLLFCPCPEASAYDVSFSSHFPDIKVLNPEKADIQQLLKNSSILITDYSPAYFDMAYMSKPILFYRFDKEKYEGDGRKEYVIDPHQFGRITENLPDLLDAMSDLLDNRPDHQDYDRNFFAFHDTDSCQRTYDAVLKTIEWKKSWFHFS
jgi:CDP-glycerol glycerophosphotransferase